VCEFLVRCSDNRIIRCVEDGFAWGAMETYSAFVNSHRQFGDWHNKLYLIRCPDMSAPEGEGLIGSVYAGPEIEHECTMAKWEIMSSVTDD